MSGGGLGKGVGAPYRDVESAGGGELGKFGQGQPVSVVGVTAAESDPVARGRRIGDGEYTIGASGELDQRR